MKRLGLAVLAAAWVLTVVIGWVWFGTTIHAPVAAFYWSCSWVLAAGVGSVPFIVYTMAKG